MIDCVSIPVSTNLERLRYLDGLLSSLHRHSRRQHELVLVTEDDGEALLAKLDPWRARLRIRVVHADPIDWGLDPRARYHGEGKYKYNPVYQFLNLGVREASEPWVLVSAGDDSYFPPDWEWLLNAVEPENRMREIWIPRYMCVVGGEGNREEMRREFGGPYGGRNRIEFRIAAEPGEPFIRESVVLREAERWKSQETVREPTGVRQQVSWPHAVVHRELFDAAGRYQEIPPYPDSHDIHFHDALRNRGVVSVGVHNSVVVNAKMPVRLGV